MHPCSWAAPDLPPAPSSSLTTWRLARPRSESVLVEGSPPLEAWRPDLSSAPTAGDQTARRCPASGSRQVCAGAEARKVMPTAYQQAHQLGDAVWRSQKAFTHFLLSFLPRVASSHSGSGGWRGPAVSTVTVNSGVTGSHTPAWGRLLGRPQPGDPAEEPTPWLPEQGLCCPGPACPGRSPTHCRWRPRPTTTPAPRWTKPGGPCTGVGAECWAGLEAVSPDLQAVRVFFPPPNTKPLLDSSGIQTWHCSLGNTIVTKTGCDAQGTASAPARAPAKDAHDTAAQVNTVTCVPGLRSKEKTENEGNPKADISENGRS